MSIQLDENRRRTGLAALARRARRVPLAASLGLVVIAVYIFVALFAPLIAPYGENEIVSGTPYALPDAQFLLGTDQLGRDFLSRLIFGARNSIGIALITTVTAFVIGGFAGILAATAGGVVDQILSRLVDAMMCIPELIFALLLLTVLGSSTSNLILIIAVLGSSPIFRISRAAAMNIVALDYIEVARARGEKVGWLVVHEVLPNIVPILTSEFGMRLCFILLKIAALSFLGVGLQPPMADWGSMVRENSALLTSGDIIPLIPALAIAVLAIAINFVGDRLIGRSHGLSAGQS